jgi:hypothetical protein
MGSIPDVVIGFFNLPNLSSHIVALEMTQPLTEMSTRNLPGGKGFPARKVDNLTAFYEPTIYKISTKCGSLYVSQPYRPPQPVIGIALPLPYSKAEHVSMSMVWS